MGRHRNAGHPERSSKKYCIAFIMGIQATPSMMLIIFNILCKQVGGTTKAFPLTLHLCDDHAK